MNRDLKTVTDWIKAPESFSPPDVLKAAVRLSSLKRGPRKSLSLPGKSRKERRAERRDLAEQIRAEVFKRAAGKCECCMRNEPTEWHHLLSGGQRRTHESKETTAAICFECHRALHRNDPDALLDMLSWAVANHSQAAADAIERRMRKVNESR